MKEFTGDELGRAANFAENGNPRDIQERLRKRLSQDRRPSTRASTTSWVNWGGEADILGQPFDVTRIPITKLEQMRRDPVLSFGLTFSKIPLIRAPWYIKSADPQRAAFIDGALRKIYGRFILAYTNCFDFGFSALVKRFELAESMDWTYIDGDSEKKVWDKAGVKPLLWKPFLALNPKTVSPHWTAKGEFAGIDFAPATGVGYFGTSGFPATAIFGDGNRKVADIPLDWALWATNEKDSVYGNLFGYPRIGYAYRYWWSYWYKFGLADRAFEKLADPPVIVYHPTDDGLSADGSSTVDFSSEALALAEKTRSGANIALPSDPVLSMVDDRAMTMRQWEITQLETKTQFDMFNETFEYLDVMKLRSIMVPEQSLTEGKGGSSSRNVAQVYGDFFQESQAVVMQEIDDHINRFMIPQLLEANFGPGGATCEKITTGFDPQDLDTMRTVIGAIANRETEVLPVDLRETLKRLGIPLQSHEEHQRALEEKAKEQERLRAPETVPGRGGSSAGVNASGQYYSPREIIHLEDDEHGTFRKIFDKLLGRSTQEETED